MTFWLFRCYDLKQIILGYLTKHFSSAVWKKWQQELWNTATLNHLPACETTCKATRRIKRRADFLQLRKWPFFEDNNNCSAINQHLYCMTTSSRKSRGSCLCLKKSTPKILFCILTKREIHPLFFPAFVYYNPTQISVIVHLVYITTRKQMINLFIFIQILLRPALSKISSQRDLFAVFPSV